MACKRPAIKPAHGRAHAKASAAGKITPIIANDALAGGERDIAHQRERLDRPAVLGDVRDVPFTPPNGHCEGGRACPLCATRRLMHRNMMA